jgi:hypothetical protein
MATEPESNASPICYLSEADDIYRGYVTSDEVQQLVQRWIKLAPSPAIAQALTALLPSVLAGTGGDQPKDDEISPPAPLPIDMLRDEIHRLLPRIRDDAAHAALTSIARSISADNDQRG